MTQSSMWKRALPTLGLLATLVLFVFAMAVRPAAAAGIVVNTDADNTTAGDTFCTLREAINNANSDSDTTGGDCTAGSLADDITFDADYTITLAGSQLPSITTAVTITGNGPANTIIQANAAPNTATYRVFQLSAAGNLTLDGVTVRNGRCAGSCNQPRGFDGGAVLNAGTLAVTNSTIAGSTAVGSGGGIFNSAGSTVTVFNSTLSGNSADNFGGAIVNELGTVTVTNSTLSSNSTGFDGGGIWNFDAPLTVTNSTLSGNSAGSDGGGIYNINAGPLTVTNSTLSGNSAGDNGGGILTRDGIKNSTLTVTNSTLSGNSATAGDEIYRLSGTVNADAFNVFGHSGQTNADALFGITPGASDVTATSDGTDPTALTDILDTTLDDNGGPTFTHALVAGSPAIDLGPTVACAAAPVNGVDQRGEPRNTDIPGEGSDTTNLCDAGAYEYNGPPAFCTGFPLSAGTETQLNEAITCYNLLDASGSYTIDLTADIDLTASTVAIDNPIAGIDLLLDGQGFTVDGQDTPGLRPFEVKADSDATFDDITITGGNVSGNGGGILNFGTLDVTDSTLSGNSADNLGGGIFNNSGTLTVTNSTVSGNSASSGGGIFNGGRTLTVTNSTLSGNSADFEGGGLYVGTGNLTLVRSLVSGNSSASRGAEITRAVGTITANANNVFGHSGLSNGTAFNGFVPGASDFNATTSGTPVALGNILNTTLADNGGSTQTLALVSGSPAIDFGPTAACAAAPVNGVDQRGEPRSVDVPGTGNDGGADLCDAGAFELQPPPTGTIEIVKVANPADDTVFSFTDDIESPNSFTLQDPSDDTKTFNNVPTGGSYTVTELDTPGWPLTALVCSAAGSSTVDDTNLAGGFAVVTNLDAGDTVTCTFTNTQCQPGTYDNGGNVCVDAPAGSFVPTPGATEPTECPAGKWQDQTGAIECKLADPGFFVPDPGATEQTECPPGFTSEAGATECTIPVSTNACPIDDPGVGQGTVGSQLTTLLGTGMGSPTRSKMVAKVTIPNAADVTELYGQMAAKEHNGVRYVRFIFGDKTYQQVPTDGGTFDLGQTAAISWWGDDLTTQFQSQNRPFVKGRWFLQKGMKKMRLPRAIVFYATHDTGDTEYANAWSTFTSPDNFVAGTPGFDQTNSNILAIPETQATTDIVVQLAVTDVNRDARSVDVIVRAGGVEVTTTLTSPTNKKSELLDIFEVTLEDVPAGVDEVEIELVSVLDQGDSAALLGAAASYACELP